MPMPLRTEGVKARGAELMLLLGSRQNTLISQFAQTGREQNRLHIWRIQPTCFENGDCPA